MTILDRYLLMLFVRIFAVCFLSFAGLFIVIHLFSNLDELAALADEGSGWLPLMRDFYVPRLVDMFDKISAMMALFAAIFAVALMQRRREVTAIEAAGLPLKRVLRPVMVVSLIIIAVAAVNREWLLPNFRNQLVRTPQNWSGNSEMPMSVQDDFLSGVRLRGNHVIVAKQEIAEPDVQLPYELGQQITRVRAEMATIEPAVEGRPAGLLLSGVTFPESIAKLPSMTDGKHFAVLTAADQSWLAEDECFVACEFDAERIAFGNLLNDYQTIPEMMKEVRKPQTSFGKSGRLELHARLMKPFLDMTLILLGLPIVLSQTDRNVFVSAGICMLLVGGFHMATIVSHSLGNYNIVHPAALAAWLPLIVFAPMALLSMRKLR